MKVLKRVENLENIMLPNTDLKPIILKVRWLGMKVEDSWVVEIPAEYYYGTRRRPGQPSWPRRHP